MHAFLRPYAYRDLACRAGDDPAAEAAVGTRASGPACSVAAAESAFRIIVFHGGRYRTIADVEYATAGWVDWFKNRRLHSSLGYVPPVEFENAHYATLNREPQPA